MNTRMDSAITNKDKLPKGWEWSKLGEISAKSQYGWTTKANHETGRLKLLRTTDITSGSIDWSSVPFCTEEPEDVEKYLVESGDILISRAGSVGVSFLINKPERAVFASYLIRFRPKHGIDTKYFYYYLKSPAYWEAIGASKSGIAVPNVNASKLALVPIPLAPLDQQKHVVAEIEKQFSRLDEAVANLKRIKANLKRYKAAVLKAAVEGKLVPTERPWKQVVLGDIVTSIRNGYSKKPDAEQGTRIFRISAVRSMKLDANDVRYLSGVPADYQSFLVASGDVLFTRYNGSRDYVGVCARVQASLPPTVYPDKHIRVRVPDSMLRPEFLIILASTGRGREYIESKIRTTAGQSGISGGDLKSLPLDFPRVAEQEQIVVEVERRLSVIDELETTVEANLIRADRLRQAILQQAFRGTLVE